MSDSRLRRIAFVTRHYQELRGGVTRAAIAAVLLPVGMVADSLTGSLPFVLLNAGAILFAFGVTRRWMDRRLGRVVSGPDHEGIVTFACLLVFFVTDRLDSHGVDPGRPAAMFLAPAAYALWLCVRLWPFALHNLLPVVVAVIAAVTFSERMDRDAFLAWERTAYVYTLLAWTASGLIDLALLLKLLPNRHSQVSHADA